MYVCMLLHIYKSLTLTYVDRYQTYIVSVRAKTSGLYGIIRFDFLNCGIHNSIRSR